MTATEVLKAYAQRIRDQRRANAEVTEPALAPAFQQLIEQLLPLLAMAPELTVARNTETRAWAARISR